MHLGEDPGRSSSREINHIFQWIAGDANRL